MIEVHLNSFVRRTSNTNELKRRIISTGATLCRKGRSRNWRLSADTEQLQQIIDIIYSSAEDSWIWLAKTATQSRPLMSHEDLLTEAKKKPAITVNELVASSHCSTAEARAVLDELEWKDHENTI